ncbi:MAG TPA: GH25 family lysozyme [Verrucomicrobiae bacterium]
MRGPLILFLFVTTAFHSQSHAQRLLGLDISAWQGNISQTTWNNLRTVENRQFVFIRSSRGGTTGFYNQNDPNNTAGNNTLSQRYDDPYFIQNINRATAAGIYAGPYHFSRPDVIESTPNSGGIRNSGANEADHFIQMAGPFMRPGYLVPIHDLEAGDGIRTDNEMAQFAVDFSNRIFERMGIRPGIYINGNYTANILQPASQSLRDQLARPAANSPSVYAPAYPILWVARWPNQTNPNSIDVQNTNPKDTYAGFYGPWDDYGDSNPWDFWQYASTARLQSFNNGANNLDVNVLNGDLEYLKDQLVPAVWMTDSSGDWSTLANWNSGQTPIAPAPGPGQVTPIGTQTLPTPRLPGASGTGVTSGRNDTVILERTNANITVSLSTGTHNIRKLYMREALNITGGSLTINYDPTYASNPSFPNTARSGPISAQFSGPVTISGGSLNVHTLEVDLTRTLTLNGGALTFDTIRLLPSVPNLGSPGSIKATGNVTLNPLGNTTGNIVTVIDTPGLGQFSLGGTNCNFTIGNGPQEVDISINVQIADGHLTKRGPGSLRLIRNPARVVASVQEGALFIDATDVRPDGDEFDVTVEGGILGGTGGILSGDVVVYPSGTVTAGNSFTLASLTFSKSPTLQGTTLLKIHRAGGSPIADQLICPTSTMIYDGRLVITNVGPSLLGGEVFTNFSAQSYTGTFDSMILPPLNPGLNWFTDTLLANGTIAVNRRPIANEITLTNFPPTTLEIPIATLLASATDSDGDPLHLASLALTTTQGITLTTSDTHLFYANNIPVPDQFTYTITDDRGGTTTNTVHITNDGRARFASAPILNNTGLTLNFVARPGSTNYLDRSTNLLDWITISTNIAPASGLFQYFDPNPPLPAALYKLQTPE